MASPPYELAAGKNLQAIHVLEYAHNREVVENMGYLKCESDVTTVPGKSPRSQINFWLPSSGFCLFFHLYFQGRVCSMPPLPPVSF